MLVRAVSLQARIGRKYLHGEHYSYGQQVAPYPILNFFPELRCSYPSSELLYTASILTEDLTWEFFEHW